MASISRIQAQAVTATSAPALTWTTTAGNLLVVSVRLTGSGATITPPSGWTTIFQGQINATRACGVYAKVAAGGTGDRQAWTGSSGSVVIYGFEFQGSTAGSWAIGSTLGTDYQVNGDSTTTGVTNIPLTSYAANPSLLIGVAWSLSQAASGGIGGINSLANGIDPDLPTGYSTLMTVGWEYTTAAASYTATYADASPNAREIFLASIPFNVVSTVPGTGARTMTFTGLATALVPTITSISVNHGPCTGGTTVVITGTGFDTATGVVDDWLESAASFTVDSSTQITAVTGVSLGGQSKASTTGILVTGTGGNSNGVAFMFDAVGTASGGPTVSGLATGSAIAAVPGTGAETATITGLATGAATGMASGTGAQTATITGLATGVVSLPATGAQTTGFASSVYGDAAQAAQATTFTALATGTPSSVAGPVDPSITANARLLWSYLQTLSVAGTNTLSGSTLGYQNQTAGDSYDAEFDQFRLTAGQLPAIMRICEGMYFLNQNGPGTAFTYDSNGVPIWSWTWAINRATNHARAGGLIEFTALPWCPTPVGGPLHAANTASPSDTSCLQYGPNAAAEIGYGSSVAQTQDNKNLNAMLDSYAVFFQAMSALGVPVLFRMYAESNDPGGFWWNVPWFYQLWRYSVGYLTGSGGFPSQGHTATPVHNLLFNWNQWAGGGLLATPPAASLVDIVSVDRYGANAGHQGVMKNFLNSMQGISADYSTKIRAVSECFDHGGTGTPWWTLPNATAGPDVSTFTSGSPGSLTGSWEQIDVSGNGAGQFAVPTTKGIVVCSYASYTHASMTFNGVVAVSGNGAGNAVESGSLIEPYGEIVGRDPTNDNANLLVGIQNSASAYFIGWDVFDNLVFQQNFKTLWSDPSILNLDEFTPPYSTPGTPGTAAQTSTLTTVGTGKVSVPGTGAPTATLTGLATATVTLPATASPTATISGLATATVTVAATATQTATVTSLAIGSWNVGGEYSASGFALPIGITTAGAATLYLPGSGAATAAITGLATGTVTVRGGTAAQTTTVTVTAEGAVVGGPVPGTAAQSSTLSSIADGTVELAPATGTGAQTTTVYSEATGVAAVVAPRDGPDFAVAGIPVSTWQITASWWPGSTTPGGRRVMKLSTLSTQFFPVPITAMLDGVAHDPTADLVEFAFVAGKVKPQSADWIEGVWEPGGDRTAFTAKVLIGPEGRLSLMAGTYTAWIRVTDNPEQPVMKVGVLEITDP